MKVKQSRASWFSVTYSWDSGGFIFFFFLYFPVHAAKPGYGLWYFTSQHMCVLCTYICDASSHLYAHEVWTQSSNSKVKWKNLLASLLFKKCETINGSNYSMQQIIITYSCIFSCKCCPFWNEMHAVQFLKAKWAQMWAPLWPSRKKVGRSLHSLCKFQKHDLLCATWALLCCAVLHLACVRVLYGNALPAAVGGKIRITWH